MGEKNDSERHGVPSGGERRSAMPVGSRPGWRPPPEFFRNSEADSRPSWAEIGGWSVFGGVVFAVCVAVAVVTDGRPEWLTTAASAAALAALTPVVRLTFHRVVPSQARRAWLRGVGAPVLLLVFFGAMSTFIAWAVLGDPGCTDCGGSDGLFFAVGVLVVGWGFGLFLMVANLRRWRQDHPTRRH